MYNNLKGKLMDKDLAIRLAAFQWLKDQIRIYDDILPRDLLQQGFEFEGTRIPLVSPQGIFKPKIMDLPLSITTSPNSPYDDKLTKNGFLEYKYRGTNPNAWDNIALRKAFEQKKPLVYLHGVMPGKYIAVWPVYIVNDNPNKLYVEVAIDDIDSISVETSSKGIIRENIDIKRAYITSTIRQRLHQQSFRERVLAAYQSQCAFCQLKHRELLDASHIIPDHLEQSKPTVDNGMALCKLHHAAFDQFILGVTPDFKIIVREDILEEIDGPILKHGIQELHGQKIILPKRKADWPNQEALEWRFVQFRAAH